jgi:hypothetical protein
VTVLQFPSYFPSHFDRRRPENRLKRVTVEAEQLEERQIDYWLSLADSAFDDSWEPPKPASDHGENEQAA